VELPKKNIKVLKESKKCGRITLGVLGKKECVKMQGIPICRRKKNRTEQGISADITLYETIRA